MRSNYASAVSKTHALVECTPDQLDELKTLAEKAAEALKNTKKQLNSTDKILIGTVAFVTVGLLTTALVNAIQNREQPDAAVNPQTVELAEQKVASHTPDQLAFAKQ